MKFDHVGIQVRQLDTCISWYKAVFNAAQNWTLTEFSHLTLRRLPGITVLTEIQSDEIKLHLFERSELTLSGDRITKFQHIAINVAREARLEELQQLASVANKRFGLLSEISEIVWDKNGVGSLYLADPEGNEFEITHSRERS
ncbi:VOC family protein [Paraburkholderia flava]|uniref:VOC family protein n=1 Tax=Paraburkholderia flava TaxID=2547393 RepID=UPI001061D894|nr:VOC family protein [Paraburkholderia flava]